MVLHAVIGDIAGHYAVRDDDGSAAQRQQLFAALRAASAHGIARLNKAIFHRQAAGCHGLPVGGKALFGGRKPRNARNKANAGMALRGQGFYRLPQSGCAVHADAAACVFEHAVYQHGGKPGRKQGRHLFPLPGRAGQQQAVYCAVAGPLQMDGLARKIFFCVGNHQPVTRGHQHAFHRLDGCGKKAVGNIGHNKQHRMVPACFQIACHLVWNIVQLANCLFHLLRHFFRHKPASVDDVAYGGG